MEVIYVEFGVGSPGAGVLDKLGSLREVFPLAVLPAFFFGAVTSSFFFLAGAAPAAFVIPRVKPLEALEQTVAAGQTLGK